MEEWTESRLLIALAWLKEQWNKPSRTDHYLMRIAQRAHQWTKGNSTLKDQIVNFEFKKIRSIPLTQEERVARSKAIWIGGVEASKAITSKGR